MSTLYTTLNYWMKQFFYKTDPHPSIMEIVWYSMVRDRPILHTDFQIWTLFGFQPTHPPTLGRPKFRKSASWLDVRTARVPSILVLASPITKSWISPCLNLYAYIAMDFHIGYWMIPNRITWRNIKSSLYMCILDYEIMKKKESIFAHCFGIQVSVSVSVWSLMMEPGIIRSMRKWYQILCKGLVWKVYEGL